MIPLKNSLENIVNKEFDPIDKKIDDLNNKLSHNLSFDDIKIKLTNSETQINKILQTYDKLSKNELSIEEKYLFAQFLTNLYNKSSKLIDIDLHFNINMDKIKDYIKQMKSSNIHEKVIGIDNFMSLAHTNNSFLIELVAINNSISNRGKQSTNDDIYTNYLRWKIPFDTYIVDKLNEIRNRKGLSRFKYQEM